MTRTDPAKRFARASRGLAALALLWGAGAAAACASPNGDAARSPMAQAPDAAAQGTRAPTGQGAPDAAAQTPDTPAVQGTARAPAAGRGTGTRPPRRQDTHAGRSVLAHKIALQKQLLATLEDCPGANCPDPKLAAPATRTCARLCVKHWADCMGPCTADQRFCEQHCTEQKRSCEDACPAGKAP